MSVSKLHEPMQVIGHDDIGEGFSLSMSGRCLKHLHHATRLIEIDKERAALRCDRGDQVDAPRILAFSRRGRRSYGTLQEARPRAEGFWRLLRAGGGAPTAHCRRPALGPKGFGAFVRAGGSAPTAHCRRPALGPKDFGAFVRAGGGAPTAHCRRPALGPKGFGAFVRAGGGAPTARCRRPALGPKDFGFFAPGAALLRHVAGGPPSGRRILASFSRRGRRSYSRSFRR